MANVKKVEVYSNIEPKVYSVSKLGEVLFNIQSEYIKKDESFPEEIKIQLSMIEWTSIVRDSKNDQSLNLVFDPKDVTLAHIHYCDYDWPFKVSICYNCEEKIKKDLEI